jgi:indolepyruvate ferredoxin oxidoreductase
MTELLSVSLEDRYAAQDGPALMNGTQALVRMILEQQRLDAARGLNTGAFVSGYPGSPLGGLDREIARSMKHLAPAGVAFQPGLNEELAATAVAGTQLVGELPGRRRDGVVGWWYGKAPGLDRAADAIRHGNTSGTATLGGAVALIGDDPTCKSSTLPSSCELMAESLVLPLLAPGSVADIVRLGLHAVAMSREAGCWTAMKIVSDVADASATVELSGLQREVPEPPQQSRGAPPTLLGASSVAAEHDLMGRRLQLARDYGRRQALNRVVVEPDRPRLAILAPGPAYATLRRALDTLGVDDDALGSHGVRLVLLELPFPLHPDDVAAFVEGVEEVMVVEDKRPFIERQLRDLLYGTSDAPRIIGKRDEKGRELVGLAGAVDADALARRLAKRWGTWLADDVREQIRPVRLPTPVASALVRTPYFCSGCPHNLSTRSPDDQLVGAGIGCHSLIAVDPMGERGHLLGAPQMGGEGAQWIGMAPFTADEHYVQNIGDGTFYHSGSLAIRAAVAAGLHITYRLLHNDAIAMTGGQTPQGRMEVADLVRWLTLEGVARVVITTEEPDTFDGHELGPSVAVRHRDALEEVQAELAATPGVTVLVHTDRCATEERRLRKRGKLPTPAEHVWINERVCEGCGDCGRKSTCLSVVPTETEFGRKTQIHQSSCTQDFACVEGDCPSFLMITPGEGPAPAPPGAGLPVPVALVDPSPRFDLAEPVLVRMPGIGGTGVVTVSALLQMAALLEGHWASALDQTGLAQKGGAVVSDVRIALSEQSGATRAAGREVDVLLGLDLLGAITPDTLRTLDPGRTVAVVNVDPMATAAMITDVAAPAPPVAELIDQIRTAVDGNASVFLHAGRIAQTLFADHMPTNVVMLGAAYQNGCLPVGAEALEQAIRLNGAGVDANLAAFRWGRAAALDPAAVAEALDRVDAPRNPTPEGAVPADVHAAVSRAGFRGGLARTVAVRAHDLRGFQGRAQKQRYLADVAGVLAIERERVPGAEPKITEAYARALHKLMAYKDEYEVARLHLDTIERTRRESAFGSDASVSVLLHPPLLRSLGMQRKIRLSRSAVPAFRALRSMRHLRGTPLDPFGYSEVRRLERELIAEYQAAMRRALRSAAPDTHDEVATIAALPDLIRGYETIKLANVATYRRRIDELIVRLESRPAGLPREYLET